MKCDHRLLPAGWICDECGFQNAIPLELIHEPLPDFVHDGSWRRCRHTTHLGVVRCNRGAFHGGHHQNGDCVWLLGDGQCNRHSLPNHVRCMLPTGHVGSHVFTPRITQCRTVLHYLDYDLQCKLPAGHAGPHISRSGQRFFSDEGNTTSTIP